MDVLRHRTEFGVKGGVHYELCYGVVLVVPSHIPPYPFHQDRKCVVKIAVDQDDVALEFTIHVLACLKREYGWCPDYENITDWECNTLRSMRGFGLHLDGTEKTWWDWLRTRDWLWPNCPAVEGAIGGIRQLRDAGHHIEMVTSKPDWAEHVAYEWIGKWRPAFNSVTIVPLGESKADWSNADVLVDDAVHNLDPWVKSGRKAIVFDRPWNRKWTGPGIRAMDWRQVVKGVEWMVEKKETDEVIVKVRESESHYQAWGRAGCFPAPPLTGSFR